MNPEQTPQDSNLDNGINEIFFDTVDGRYKRVGEVVTKCHTYVDMSTLFSLEEKEEYDL